VSTDPPDNRIGLIWAILGIPLYALVGAGVAIAPSYFIPRGIVPQWLGILAALVGAIVGAAWWMHGVRDN